MSASAYDIDSRDEPGEPEGPEDIDDVPEYPLAGADGYGTAPAPPDAPRPPARTSAKLRSRRFAPTRGERHSTGAPRSGPRATRRARRTPGEAPAPEAERRAPEPAQPLGPSEALLPATPTLATSTPAAVADPRFSGFDEVGDPRFTGFDDYVGRRIDRLDLSPGADAEQQLIEGPGEGYLEAAPLASPRRARRRWRRAPVAVLKPQERPYVRLGVLWAGFLVVALVIGPALLAVLVAPIGAIAAASILRLGRRDRSAEPATELALLGRRWSTRQLRAALIGAVAVVPFVAIGGPTAAVGGVAVAVAAAVAAAKPVFGCSPLVGALAVGAPLAATSGVVVARDQGFAVAFVLIGATCLYDLASRLMGRGLTGGFIGMVSGLATMVVLGFLVIALADPPFRGKSAWALCVIVGLLSWLGTKLCRRLLRHGPYPPALARLDSLAVAAPVWVVLVATVLHR